MDISLLKALYKANPVTAMDGRLIRLCPARLSYPNLAKPREQKKGDPRYSCDLLFAKGANLSVLVTACDELGAEKFPGKKFTALIKDQGDKEGPHYVAGAKLISPWCHKKPLLVDGKKLVVDDPDKFYAGCWVVAMVQLFSYDNDGNRGIGFGLRGLQFVADDEAFGGGGLDADMFADNSSFENEMEDDIAF